MATEEEEEEGEDVMSDAEHEGNARAVGSSQQNQSRESQPHGRNSRAKREKDERLFTAEAHAMLMQLFHQEHKVLSKIYNTDENPNTQKKPSPDRFFIQQLLVPPNKFRKEQQSSPGKIAESPDNTAYRNILNNCIRVSQIEREISEQVIVEGRQARGFPQLQASLQSHTCACKGRSIAQQREGYPCLLAVQPCSVA